MRNFIKRSLVISITCLLMLVAIPTMASDGLELQENNTLREVEMTNNLVITDNRPSERQLWKSNSKDDNDTMPPVSNHVLCPATPDGENGWYASDMEITLMATDDLSGVDFIKYLLDDKDWMIYTSPLVIESDGYHRITYYAVDKAGNVEQPSEVLRLKMDQTVPDIEKFVYEGWWKDGITYLNFEVQCSDALSGMDRIEFYKDNELILTIDEEPYVWTIEWSGEQMYILVYDKAGNYLYDDHPDSISYNKQVSKLGNFPKQ